MQTNDLTQLESRLKRGDKMKLATMLRVHPSKVTLAFSGLIVNPEFMESLQAKTIELLSKREAIAS